MAPPAGAGDAAAGRVRRGPGGTTISDQGRPRRDRPAQPGGQYGAAVRLDGKVAFVTGAGSGQGREIALRFASEGARVAAADLLGDTAAQTAAEIEGALALEVDVTRPESITAGL